MRFTRIFFCVALLVAMIAPRDAQGQGSACCAADLSGDGLVGAEDVSVLLAAWSQPGAADIDGSGQVDAGDLSMLLGAWGRCSPACTQTTIVGTVVFTDGCPASGALVLTDLGGKAVTDASGAFSFEVDVGQSSSLILSATVAAAGGTAFGSALIPALVLGGTTDAGELSVSIADACSTEFGWLPKFTPLGATGPVYAFAVYDDGKGGGPNLYVAGRFDAIGPVAVGNIARWDGEHWSAVGVGADAGPDDYVFTLAVFDEGNGSGPALFAGGLFTSVDGNPIKRIARWDGDVWSAVGSPIDGVSSSVKDMLVFDDGSGPALFVAGAFLSAGGVPVNRIAKWDGQTWSPLTGANGTGVSGTVEALLAFDDGTGRGEELYAGGDFLTAGGVPVWNVARWNGREWSAMGSGGQTGSGKVWALAAYDAGLGAGAQLYAGGNFLLASAIPGGALIRSLALWNGSAWAPVGPGFVSNGGKTVFALAVHDEGDGAGAYLTIAGDFDTAGGVVANNIARWNGTSFSTVGSGATNGTKFTIFGLHSLQGVGHGQPRLVVGGSFVSAGGGPYKSIASWDGRSWSGFADGPGKGIGGVVYASAVYDDGEGPVLYVGGSFEFAGDVAARNVARWDGSQWSSLGTGASNGTDGFVNALAVYDDQSGTGPKLYVGGWFEHAGGIATNYLARWDGSAWSAVGTGLSGGVAGFVSAMVVHQEPAHSTPSLYVGGDFTNAGGVGVKHIARWNGSSWSAMGAGFSAAASPVPAVYALAVVDVGFAGGPSLFAGGGFTQSGSVTTNRVARWTGTSWSSVGTGIQGAEITEVYALCGYDDGTAAGPSLFVGGTFTTAGSVAANNIAKWRLGAGWMPLVDGGTNGVSAQVRALTVLDTQVGSGPLLCVGGEFGAAAGVLGSVVRWDGVRWLPVGASPGVGKATYSLLAAELSDGTGPSLVVGGFFPKASAQPSEAIAQWRCNGR